MGKARLGPALRDRYGGAGLGVRDWGAGCWLTPARPESPSVCPVSPPSGGLGALPGMPERWRRRLAGAPPPPATPTQRRVACISHKTIEDIKTGAR